MFDFLAHLFDTTDFPARWNCGQWSPGHGWLHILSDLAVWSAYFAIPCILVYFVLRRRDVPFPTIFWLFGAFILACGTTHLMEAIIFWHPVYRLAGVIKLLTAIVSWGTVIALVPTIPKALALRTPDELEREIIARKQAEDALQRANAELEAVVQERTAELAQANVALRHEREMLRITLASIGDAVMVADTEGRLTFLNSVAQTLTGWNEEAVGRPLAEVFRILNEQTRQPAENPIAKVIASGHVAGLANHTVLIARDGRERAIDDSAAPIRDRNGKVAGAVLVFRDVTQQRQAERISRFLASIVESSDDVIIGKDIGGVITSWNRAAERLFGYPAAEAIGRPVAILAPPDRADEMPAILARLQQGEQIEHFDTVRRAKNGRLVPISLTVSPIKDAEGRVIGASKIARDISERKKAEEALHAEKERLHATLTGIGDAVIVTDSESRVTMMNPVAQALTGWNEGAIGRPLEEVFRIINEQTRQPVESPVSRVVREGTVVGLANHTVLITRNGTETPIDDSGAPVRNPAGEIVAVVLVFRDVSAHRREAEERRRRLDQLSEAERRLDAELEAVTRLHDLSSRLMVADDLRAALGDVLENAIVTSGADFGNIQLYDPDSDALEIVAQRGFGQDFLDYFRRVQVDEGSACAQAMQSGERIVIEDVELDPAYEPHRPIAAAAGYRAVQSTPVKSTTGAILGMLSTHFRRPHRPSERDQQLLDLYAHHAANFLERLRYEQALREQAELLDLAHDAIIVRTTEGVITFWSRGAEQMYGWPKETVLGKVTHSLLQTKFPSPLPEIDAELADRGWWDGTLTHTRQDGRPIVVASRWTVRQSASRKAAVVLEINNDITERMRVERERDERAAELAVALAKRTEEVRRAENAEQLLREADRRKDEFLAILAHELRNPLAPLRNALELLRLTGADDKPLTEQARDMMERQVSQIVRLVDDLLDVSRITQGKLQLRKERVELTDVLNAAVEIARPIIDASAHELTVAMPPQSIHVHADPVRLAQVFSNLLNNAAKYTEKSGHIWLTAERRGNEAVVSVRDTGIGIAPEHMEQIFKVFSQMVPALERSQGGLGIGLSLVKGLVEMHGGTIDARSGGLGKGSEFTIHLPIVDVPVEAAPKPGGGETADSGPRFRILVVDDHRDAANSMAMILRRIMGHDVRTAYDGLEAVQTAAAFQPNVVLLDIGLPKMNGYEVARQIREQPRDGKVALVALTGWGQEEDKRRSLEAGFDHHLTKPVGIAALEKLLTALTPVLQQ
jgi:PAS domain S-box-containing protein